MDQAKLKELTTKMNEMTEERRAILDLAGEAEADLMSHAVKMRAQAKDVIRKMEEVLRNLEDEDRYGCINTLGELQTRGTEMDILCGEMGKLREQVRRSRAVVRRIEAPEFKAVVEGWIEARKAWAS